MCLLVVYCGSGQVMQLQCLLGGKVDTGLGAGGAFFYQELWHEKGQDSPLYIYVRTEEVDLCVVGGGLAALRCF